MNFQELMADVTAADAEGPLCDYWTTPLYSVSISLLAELELVKPIKTRVPPCSNHWCLFAATCPHRERFETAGPGRSGVKAKLTPAGKTAFRSRESLLLALEKHRIVHTIRSAVAMEPQSLFDLHTRLLQACRDELNESGTVEKSAFQRSDLQGCLELLEALDEVEWNRQTGRVQAKF